MANRNVIRIPNLPIGRMVDENGIADRDELTFRETLITNLQRLFGNEGCVFPSLSAADITTIQNNVDAQGNYTCAFGTALYNIDANSIMIAINNGSGAPIFKTVTLT